MDLSPTIQDENLTPLLGEPPMSRYIIGHWGKPISFLLNEQSIKVTAYNLSS